MSRFARSGWLAVLGVAVAAVALFGGGLGRENFSHAPVVAVGTGGPCLEVVCGMNHSQVLL
jgi:hypothetical protein